MRKSGLAQNVDSIETILRRQSLDGERAFKAFQQCLGASASVAHPVRLGRDSATHLYSRTRAMFPGVFPEEQLIVEDQRAFFEICDLIQQILEEEGRVDVMGFTYEHFFSDLFKGKTGKYFTPRTVVDFCIDLAGIQENHIVCDPTCGSGGFLARLKRHPRRIVGNDIDPLLSRATSLNLQLSGFSRFEVYQSDVFDLQTAFHKSYDGQVDVMLANPPFSLPITDERILTEFEWPKLTRSIYSDELFLESAARLLKPGGHMVTLVPYSMVANTETGPFREWLATVFDELAVVALPEGLFYPFGGSGARACIIAMSRRGHKRRQESGNRIVLKAAVENVGYDLRAKKFRPTEENDFKRIVESQDFKEFVRDHVDVYGPGVYAKEEST